MQWHYVMDDAFLRVLLVSFLLLLNVVLDRVVLFLPIRLQLVLPWSLLRQVDFKIFILFLQLVLLLDNS